MRDSLFFSKQELGRVETKKGKLAEQRVLQAINTFAIAEPWFQSVRIATRQEDAKGIDLVVETLDIGALYLQVKSSCIAAEQFKEKHLGMVIAVLVIPFYGKPEIIWKKVLPEIIKLRDEIKRRRNYH